MCISHHKTRNLQQAFEVLVGLSLVHEKNSLEDEQDNLFVFTKEEIRSIKEQIDKHPDLYKESLYKAYTKIIKHCLKL